MKPKIGEAVLIGVMNTSERDNPFGGMFGGETKIKIGGDRSYVDAVWVCVASEDDRCAIVRLLRKGERTGGFDFGATEPRIVEYESYPVSKCSEQMLRVMTGYTLQDDLLSIAMKQIGVEVSNN